MRVDVGLRFQRGRSMDLSHAPRGPSRGKSRAENTREQGRHPPLRWLGRRQCSRDLNTAPEYIARGHTEACVDPPSSCSSSLVAVEYRSRIYIHEAILKNGLVRHDPALHRWSPAKDHCDTLGYHKFRLSRETSTVTRYSMPPIHQATS